MTDRGCFFKLLNRLEFAELEHVNSKPHPFVAHKRLAEHSWLSTICLLNVPYNSFFPIALHLKLPSKDDYSHYKIEPKDGGPLRSFDFTVQKDCEYKYYNVEGDEYAIGRCPKSRDIRLTESSPNQLTAIEDFTDVSSAATAASFFRFGYMEGISLKRAKKVVSKVWLSRISNGQNNYSFVINPVD